jgi:hypothetical protein
MLNCGICGKGVQYASNSIIHKQNLTCLYVDCKENYFISNVHSKIYHPFSWEFNISGKYLIFLKPQKYLSGCEICV